MREFSGGRFCLLMAFVFACLLVAKVIFLIWWKPRKIERHFARQGISGPPYRLFIGNGREIISIMLKASAQPMPLCHNILPRVLAFYHHWKKIYGGTFLVWFGPTPRLAISDPELIREIFGSKSQFYEKNESHPVIRQLEGDGLLTLKGEKWAYHRKIISPSFHVENLKLFIPEIGNKMVELMDKWTAMSSNDEVEVEVSEWFQSLTEDVVTRTAFGCSYGDGKDIVRLQSQQMVLVAEAFRKVFIPGLRFLPTRKNMMAWKLDRQIVSSIVELVRRRKENTGAESRTAKDMLGLMINAVPATKGTLSTSITVEDITAECKAFFFAGKSTTSNLLTWTTVLLAMHPEWQHLAREEVIRVCGSHEIPTADHISKLKTLGMIVNEALRLYPPVVATIRRAKVDVELGPYQIPKGTELLVPILAIHHDPGLWGPDAAEFNPARFRDGVARAARHPLAFIPFGLGARTCIGQNLALLQAKVAVAAILRRFSFSLAPKYRHAPTVLMLLYPQHGAPVVFRRLPHPAASHDDGPDS